MGDYASYRRFLERQDRLARMQAAPALSFIAADGQRFIVQPDPAGRPLLDLPVDFWVQCLVGLVAWLVSAAVFAFRPGEASARYLLLSGAATLLFAPAAATYTTRELAVPGTLLQWASDLNFLGGSLFAASFVALLLVYPRRIAPRWVGPSVVALFVLWFVAQQIGLFESMTFARRFLVLLGVLATFVLAGAHWRISGRHPLERAKLQWFLLSWVVGTSVFCFFILLPQSFGIDTSPIQGYAFLLFLLVYGGLALGILRYRLFDLGEWWRRVMAWALAVLLLVVMDLFFVYGLQFSTGTSLAVALLICGLVWLPARAWLWQRFAPRNSQDTFDLFQRVVDVALAPPGTENEVDRWRAVIHSVFEPLEMTQATGQPQTQVQLQDDGLTMVLPPVGRLPGLELRYARGGRALFHPRDAAQANELVSMLEHALASLAAYEKGVAEERTRIARDMHDNIGAQLLSALHSSENATKDARIRDSLSDLRAVINQSSECAETLATTLAELRLETAERLEAVGIEFKWSAPDELPAVSSHQLSHALRSILREAVSNAIRHAQPTQVAIQLTTTDNQLQLEIRDNGKGFDPATSPAGNGLGNIQARIDALDGSFKLSSLEGTTYLRIEIPCNASPS
ncbi:ATP-binding protein [Coraliomargarita sp. SDUM461003]|uniref:ATP-binding protein n=1 Tax=Thalassobacterium maritimum TaxID=3041265 RepID=A0ABU1AZF2_9BACT|nr:ATP-binding protein [Coraliomargarita sp. SDUM461003]MDQ8209516.1 ATP-binding protein [Coraliomargarita sp. SDUM461003]